MSRSIIDRQKEREALSAGPRNMGPFLLIWIGQIVSLVGSGMTCFAQNVWVYTDLGGTITHLAALAVAANLPGILVSVVAGALVDRWDRRWMMIASDTVAALATLTLRMLVVTDSFQLWHIYVIVIVISIANHAQWPAYFATVPLLVPSKNLGSANGLIEMGRSVGQIAAPLMAGMAVARFKIQGVILFDLATYLFSLVTLLIVRIPKPPVTTPTGKAQSSLLQDIVFGWRYIITRPGLLSLMILFSAYNFLIGIAGILFTPMVLSITTPIVLGGILSLGGIGMLMGSLVMTIWGGPKRRAYGVLAFMLIEGLAIMVSGARPLVPLLFGSIFVFYFAVPIANACGGVIWQSKTAPDLLGRVIAASGMVATASLQFAYLVAGPIADQIFEPLLAVGGPLADSVGRVIGVGPGRGIGLMFIVFGALSVLAVIVGSLYPRLRLLDTELPDTLIAEIPADIETSRYPVGTTLP